MFTVYTLQYDIRESTRWFPGRIRKNSLTDVCHVRSTGRSQWRLDAATGRLFLFIESFLGMYYCRHGVWETSEVDCSYSWNRRCAAAPTRDVTSEIAGWFDVLAADNELKFWSEKFSAHVPLLLWHRFRISSSFPLSHYCLKLAQSYNMINLKQFRYWIRLLDP